MRAAEGKEGCFPQVPGSIDPPLGFDDDIDDGGGDDVLDKDLENQLPKERGTTLPDSGNALPFTGTQVMFFLLLGLAATGTGFILARRGRSQGPGAES